MSLPIGLLTITQLDTDICPNRHGLTQTQGEKQGDTETRTHIDGDTD